MKQCCERRAAHPDGWFRHAFEQPLPEEPRGQATKEHDVNSQPFEGKRHRSPFLAASGLWTTPSNGWPLAVLPFGTIDLVVVVAANLFNLLMTAIFLIRPKGWKRFERVAGLVMVALALPLGAAVILNLLGKREWWFVVLPLPLILHCFVELLLDYILKLDFRKTRLLGPYLALFYLGQMGLIGYAFVVEPTYGFVTLATYFLCLGATRYAHAKGVG